MFVVLVSMAGSCLLMAQAADEGLSGSEVQVCCRPLPKWSGSKNPLLFALNKIIVSHLHHCYIDLGSPTVLPGSGGSFQTSGIHPIRPDNENKQPIPDQITDALIHGGECKKIQDATPEKIQVLRDELASGVCHSCGHQYHNRVASFCYNNSNTYVYGLIRGAGMTPPTMHRAPGYREHNSCVPHEEGRTRW